MTQPDVSVLVVSFNTKALLPRCFESIRASIGPYSYEIILVDNDSKDGSADYVRTQYPQVVLLESGSNLGFAGANNLGLPHAKGRYLVLLNSDAFLVGSCLEDSITLMDAHPKVGLGGAKLRGEQGEWQPSARTFPGLWNDFVTLTGLSARFSHSPLFGLPDLTFMDQNKPMSCDWVPGAFSIIRRSAVDGLFDERFFLYYEEVDLCRRIKKKGWTIMYWPQLQVIHLGGASTSQFSEKMVTKSGRQMTLWRLQAQYLYYRKNYGFLKAWISRVFEAQFNTLRMKRNLKRNPQKAQESQSLLELIHQAWNNTQAGKISPPRPWKGA